MLTTNLGSPPLWSPPAGPLKLEPDSGLVYIDQNTARVPDAPLDPLFSAIFAQNPGFKMDSVDVITDRNNIRKLVRFLDGSSSDSFQIQVEIVEGKRALFTRIDTESTTLVQGFQGYGRNFEKACTKSATGTSGYYRIVSFNFGGLRYVVRNETDAYIGHALERTAVQKHATTDSLSHSLERFQLVGSPPAPTYTPKITVRREGIEVDCSSILEIKTRAASKSIDTDETTTQLWISQTPNLASGYYVNGLFNDVKVRDMTQNIRDWEKSNQKLLCSLGHLLNQILQSVKGSESQVAVVRYEGGMKLDIIASEHSKAPLRSKDAELQDGNQVTEDNMKKKDQYKVSKNNGNEQV